MTMLSRQKVGLTAFVALFVASFAVAQAPETVRVRGTIEKVDGQTLTVKLRDGNTLSRPMSALPPIADMKAHQIDVR